MRIHPELEAMLKGSGLEWELRRGKRHAKLIVAGRLVQVLPYGSTRLSAKCRHHLNCVANVRRANVRRAIVELAV